MRRCWPTREIFQSMDKSDADIVDRSWRPGWGRPAAAPRRPRRHMAPVSKEFDLSEPEGLVGELDRLGPDPIINPAAIPP